MLAARQELVRVYTNLLQNILKHGAQNAQVHHYVREGKTYTLFSNDFIFADFLNMDRLFERFYTGNVSRNDQSTGLGLYTVRILLEKMGHRIVAERTGDRMTILIEYEVL